MSAPGVADDGGHFAMMLMRDAATRAGVEVDEAALKGSATYLATIRRGMESLRELDIAPLTPPAHCHSDMP